MNACLLLEFWSVSLVNVTYREGTVLCIKVAATPSIVSYINTQ